MSRSSARVGLVAAVLVSTASLAAPAADAKAKTPTCFGRHATISVSGNNKTVRAPKGAKGVVIIAMGKGDKVYGNDTGDRICVGAAHSVTGGKGNDSISFVSGTIHGGAGNDLLQQTGTGNATVYGDAGNDKIKLAAGNSTAHGGDGNDSLSAGTKGTQKLYGDAGTDSFYAGKATATFDGGAGADDYTLTNAQAAHTFVVAGLDDTVNKTPLRVDSPLNTPTAQLSYDGETGGVAFDQTQPVYDAADTGNTGLIKTGSAVAPAGRTLAHWDISFGDGTRDLSGNGGPPSQLEHYYIADGIHDLRLTLTDSTGKVGVVDQIVQTAQAPQPKISGSMSGDTYTASLAGGADAAAGATISSWYVSWGDGSPDASGQGAPPAALAHTYAGPGDYAPELGVVDSYGIGAQGEAFTYVDPSDSALHLVAQIGRLVSEGSHNTFSRVVYGADGTTLESGEILEVNTADSANNGGSSTTVAWGDGSPASTSEIASHSYGVPGTYTLVVTVQPSSGPAQVATEQVQVNPQTDPSVVAPAFTAEGLTTLGLHAGYAAGTGPRSWDLAVDGVKTASGLGAPPASVSRVLTAGSHSVSLHVVDTSLNQYTDYKTVVALSDYPVVNDFGNGQIGGGWVPETVEPTSDGTFAGELYGTPQPATGKSIVSGTVSFGDGSVENDPRGIRSGFFYTDPHAYHAPGDVIATATIVENDGRKASSSFLASVASPPTASISASALQNGMTVATLGSTPGANAGSYAWWVLRDNYFVTGGYGAPPSSVVVNGAQSGDTVSLKVVNDHDAYTTSTAPIPST